MDVDKTVLIGSCGGLTGIYLARQLKRRGGYRIIGMDASPISAGKFFVDEFESVPPAREDADFLEALVAVCRQDNVTYYLPTHSAEIELVAKHSSELSALVGPKFLVSSYEAFVALSNKEMANANLEQIGVPVPTSYGAHRHPASKDFPLFAKKRIGSGGSDGIIVDDIKVFESMLEDSPDFSFFEYINGPEFTVDCMFDCEGRLLGLNQRRRVKTIGGAVSITENDYSVESIPWIESIASNWLLRGCVNFQFIVDASGAPRFTDINLRYPSGGLPLTMQSGIDVLSLTLDAIDGTVREDFRPIMNPEPGLTMYRYFDEIFNYAG